MNSPTTPAEASPRRESGLWGRFLQLLATPVSGASLGIFRIFVGLIMLAESISIFLPSESSAGRSHLAVYYSNQSAGFHFPYEPFSWLPMLPSPWIESVCVLMGVSAVSLALGFRYRSSAILTFLTWGYLYAVECTRTYWMSYFYLELISLLLLMFMPAAARFSIDALKKPADSGLIPFWPIALLRGQLVITYFYAGVAKLNHDWLFDGVPVRIFLDKPWVIARLKSFLPGAFSHGVDQVVHSPILIHFLGWAGAGFDLAVGFLLLLPRTRTLGMVLMLMFHSFNHFVLFTDIGWFPILGATTATIFLEPDWPSRVRRWFSKPQIPRPDWPWFWGGAVAMPVVGAALGWRVKPTPSTPSGRVSTPFRLMRYTGALVLGWLCFQTLMPLRHHLIPGDVRFTFEGLPWSWRLKAEVYRCGIGVISLEDPKVQVGSGSERTSINWSLWPEEKVLYRKVTPEKLDWTQLPEIIVVYEPRTGDRILYNALSTAATNPAGGSVTNRINELWTKLYGRNPDLIGQTAPLPKVLEGYQRAMKRRGRQFNSAAEVIASFNNPSEENGEAQQRLQVMRRIDPFAWSSTPPKAGVFFLVEDRQLFKNSAGRTQRLDPTKWKPALPSNSVTETTPPLIVLHSDLGVDEGEILPQFFVADSLDTPDRPPEIRWNLVRDAGLSKSMHVSMQPFLLRRYARRVADTWEKAHGTRPRVHAQTSVSLNLRPPQPVVDPQADLAAVDVSWFGHNGWVMDLQPTAPVFTRTP